MDKKIAKIKRSDNFHQTLYTKLQCWVQSLNSSELNHIVVGGRLWDLIVYQSQFGIHDYRMRFLCGRADAELAATTRNPTLILFPRLRYATVTCRALRSRRPLRKRQPIPRLEAGIF